MAPTEPVPAFLSNGGATGARIHAQDWSAHPLGPIAGWPPALRTVLGVILGSSFPSFLAWGPRLDLFHNDAYLPLLGNKAADALGRPLPDVWNEVWDAIAPYAHRVLGGESFFFENFATTLERHGYREQAWFTFSYSPVRDDAGLVCGVLCTVMEVSDKVRAVARHKEAEERLALSLEASGNIGTWAYDLDTAATYVDERFARLFQVDAALAREGTELVRFTDMIHPDDRPAVLEAIDRAVITESLYDIEYRIPQRSGADVWVNARGKVFADPASGARRFAGIAVDITERKRAEQARIDSEREAIAASLRADESARRLDVLLDAAPVGIVYADTAGQLQLANASNRRIWGAHPMPGAVDEYAEWKGWWPAGAERAGQRVQSYEWPIARVLGGEDLVGGVFEIEPFGAPDTRRTILVRAAAIRDRAGNMVGAVAANMDITAQVEAERAMQESEAKFRLIADAIPQLVWSADAGGTNDYLNARWTEFTGVPAERIAGTGWSVVIHPDDLAALLAAWDTSLATGAPYEIEHRLLHHSGDYRWMLNRALVSRDASGKATRWMGTLTDIHDKKAGEDELRAQARRKDEFLAMLAHELRNPLAPISNAAQLLAMATHDPQRVRQSSDVIIRQVRHMTSLVDDLLDVSRVTRGLVELERERVDIKSVVASAVEQARPLIEARGHALDQHLTPGRCWVVGDRIRLVQVIVNLLNNAAKYTAQGGSIALSVDTGAAGVTIAVRDNGIGIGRAMLPHVFELFTQAERTPDRSQGGLGLGLALVQSLVQLHGGGVAAHSEGLGMGSTFTVTLPLAGADAPGAAGAAGEAQAALPVAAHAGRSILVVDDNVDAALSLAELLRSLGHRVAAVHDAHAALARAQADRPDLYILDIGLPDIDGYALARRLRADSATAGATLVALTGYGQAHDRVLARTAGFDHHFVKPVDLAALAQVIERASAS
ncbi:PAS domain S-box protein [Massilia sp. IC2-476]|uniref:hybrid sensor histidine kinase/response regulator n=1 Tax=Massilia sp. IC2-476 TaxID=2887199 RepID=UPI001D108A4B|nr:PAS domain S-box protein [Massilia sp. IC2-476]MCC2973663.1 PAS domain S-box protein [Massilia sp. IC2-476]